jgi:3-oxoacyl-[acyl-carrier protein] reductase
LTALGPEYERSMAASIPLKKLGTVEDIAYAALFWSRRRPVTSPVKRSLLTEARLLRASMLSRERSATERF